MPTFLSFTVIGIVYGCIYALTASGLVVTYTTSGIFNFAHGAAGMIAAWVYWQLRIGWHSVKVLGFYVTYNQVIVVIVAIAAAAGLRLLFNKTRTGIAMRAVVDNP